MVNFIFNLLVAQVVQLLEYLHSEHHHWVNRLASRVAPSILGIAPHKEKAEGLPGISSFILCNEGSNPSIFSIRLASSQNPPWPISLLVKDMQTIVQIPRSATAIQFVEVPSRT